MLKGINKQVVVVRDAGNDIFEQVIFILKPGSRRISDGDMAQEAKRIVSDCIKRYCPGIPPSRRMRRARLRALIIGGAVAAAAGLAALVLALTGVL